MSMSPDQKRQQEEAYRESCEKTHGVRADGEKHPGYTPFSDQINNE